MNSLDLLIEVVEIPLTKHLFKVDFIFLLYTFKLGDTIISSDLENHQQYYNIINYIIIFFILRKYYRIRHIITTITQLLMMMIFWSITKIQSSSIYSYIEIVIPQTIYCLSIISLLTLKSVSTKNVLIAILCPILLINGKIGTLVIFLGCSQLYIYVNHIFKKDITSINPFLLSVIFYLLAMEIFYFTRHFCEFSGLDYASGFIGINEFNIYLSGILLIINTFTPFIFIIPFSIMIISKYLMKTFIEKKCYYFYWHIVMMNYVVLRSLCCFVSIVSVTVQRRHLLIWAIFAPKFVFEVCFLIITDITMLITIIILSNN